jgi:hypothetical protein
MMNADNHVNNATLSSQLFNVNSSFSNTLIQSLNHVLSSKNILLNNQFLVNCLYHELSNNSLNNIKLAATYIKLSYSAEDNSEYIFLSYNLLLSGNNHDRGIEFNLFLSLLKQLLHHYPAFINSFILQHVRSVYQLESMSYELYYSIIIKLSNYHNKLLQYSKIFHQLNAPHQDNLISSKLLIQAVQAVNEMENNVFSPDDLLRHVDVAVQLLRKNSNNSSMDNLDISQYLSCLSQLFPFTIKSKSNAKF